MVIISLRFPLPFFISKDKEDQVFNLCFKFGLQFCGRGWLNGMTNKFLNHVTIWLFSNTIRKNFITEISTWNGELMSLAVNLIVIVLRFFAKGKYQMEKKLKKMWYHLLEKEITMSESLNWRELISVDIRKNRVSRFRMRTNLFIFLIIYIATWLRTFSNF